MKKFLLIVGLLVSSPFYVTDVIAQGQQNGEEAEECNICCSPMASHMRLPRECRHVSCVNCWGRWDDSQPAPGCPECRKKNSGFDFSQKVPATRVIDMVQTDYGSKFGLFLAEAIYYNDVAKFDKIIENLELLKMHAEDSTSYLRNVAKDELVQGLNYRANSSILPFNDKTPEELALESSNPYFLGQLDQFINYID
jgi:hypothetical protein